MYIEDFTELILCDECPCLNNDYEQGSSCNLGYPEDSYWTNKGELVEASTDCQLLQVITSEQNFEPTEKVMARSERTDR